MNDPAQLKDLEVIFARILNVAAGFAILAVFIMLLVGGFKYLTSGGDPKATESAKNTLTYAIFGLIALIGIWLLLRFVKVFTGVDVTQFTIIPKWELHCPNSGNLSSFLSYLLFAI